jgi:diaminopimelate decarboxylase
MKNFCKSDNILLNKRVKTGRPDTWGLGVSKQGELIAGGCSTVRLADTYGTPLHVVDERRLKLTARDFMKAINDNYPGKVSVHFAFKCNSVPGVVKIVQQAGLKAEVMSEYELKLALHMGFQGKDIIINGPFKPDVLLGMCLDSCVRYIVIDSLTELYRLNRLCEKLKKEADILLRINPDYIPKGMNQGSATGSRKGCAFGLDLKGGEVKKALDELGKLDKVHFHGFHFHIGTGIFKPEDYRQAINCLKKIVSYSRSRGLKIGVFDIGGGLAAHTTREMTTFEMLMYQALERLPGAPVSGIKFTFTDFALAVTKGFESIFKHDEMPELIVEPGRSIASSSQLLLLRVHQVKNRSGLRKWLITDGGIGTVTMPTFYEYHEIFLCNDIYRPAKERVTITGPVCFASDIVYRNKRMPVVHPGEVLAIMDSGAYFTSWESSFGFPRPAIVTVKDGKHILIRKRESFDEMIARDQCF